MSHVDHQDQKSCRKEAASGAAVQTWRDGWFRWWDQLRRFGASGAAEDPNGYAPRRPIYIGVALIIVAFCIVNALSKNDELTRFGRAHRVWEPFAWEASSAIILIALLALPRRASALAKGIMQRPVKVCLGLLALMVLFSAVHIVGMGALRALIYGVVGGTYSFDWSAGNLLYEFRKDAFSFCLLAVLFWLTARAFERRTVIATSTEAGDDTGVVPPRQPPPGNDIWLRDGRTSILVDARDIVWVGSAGNYVEYAMADGPRHLIRSTLQQEEVRLSDFGIARIHRTRLINLRRVVAINWRKSGDFELSFDTGETVVGSRRHKNSIARIGG